MNIAIKTLGCKLNQAEEQELIRNLLIAGHNITTFNPDIFIVNTCCVTKEAQHKSRKLIRKIIKENNNTKVIVTGCYANLNDDELNKITGIYEIIPNEKKSEIPQIIQNLNSTHHSSPIIHHPSRTRAFLKIQDGCNRFCSYCIVPYVRYKIYSKPTNKIIEEAKYLSDNNYREIVLTAACIGLYEYNLIKLLYNLEKINNIERIRLTSIDPKDVSDELIDYIATSEKLCPHLHISLQSGDDRILKLMNRNYTSDYYKKLIDKIKNKINDVAITTDIMVGFPSEDEENFNNTIKLIEYVKFTRCHIFKYSPIKKTKAYYIDNQIDENIKQKRSKILMEVARKYSMEFNQKYINQIKEVLIEENKNGCLTGYTKNYIKILIRKNNNNLLGHLLRVRITNSTPTHCEGEPVN